MRKICLVTGSRAEWGLLSRLAAMIKADQELQLQIIATNMHLSERYGLTYKEIEAAGFVIDYRVPMEAALDTAAEVVRSMGVAMQGFASAYQALQPDLLVV
ncbi:MAG: UDP-N-acetylglucosamine 2-epimerase, partial [Mucinivorans sp.]